MPPALRTPSQGNSQAIYYWCGSLHRAIPFHFSLLALSRDVNGQPRAGSGDGSGCQGGASRHQLSVWGWPPKTCAEGPGQGRPGHRTQRSRDQGMVWAFLAQRRSFALGLCLFSYR